MIYSYPELKGRIKVGDEVRAVPGKQNSCSQLNDDGSNTLKVTDVDDTGFSINDCRHGFYPDRYLEIVNEKRTLENLREGDVVVHEDDEDDKRKVMFVLKPGLYVLSCDEDGEDEPTLYSAKELKGSGYIPVLPEAEVVELSVAEAAKRMGIDPAKLKIVEG